MRVIHPDRGPGPEIAVNETASLRAHAEVSAVTPAGALPGTDFVTMADAARIKGVSYHTVSRAVRHGRLPVERVGRMALIASTDLQAWRPMTERRPRRYQHQDPTSAPVGFGVMRGSGIDAAGRYAEMADHIMTDAASLGLDAFLARWSERFAADLGCTTLSIWAASPEGDAASVTLSLAAQVKMGGDGMGVASRLGLPRTIVPMPGAQIADLLASSGAQIVSAASVAGSGIFSAGNTVLVAPVRVASRPLGLLIGEPMGGIPDAELRVLDHLLKQLACGWSMIHERVERDRRIRTLEAALDAVPVGIRLCSGTAIQYRNRRDGELYSEGSPLAEMLDDDLIQHGQSNGELVLQDAQGHRVDVEVSWVSSDPAGVDGAPWSIVVSQDQSEQMAERDREERATRALRRDVVRARAASDLARQVQGATTAAAVIQRGLPMLISAIEGDGALVKLRDLQGGLERIPFGEGDASGAIPEKVSPISYPSTVLAFARRQPVLITRYTAATFEREAMERAGWRSMLVVPLVVKDEQLGFVMIGYVDDTQADRTTVVLAGELAQVLAEAVVMAQGHERLAAELRQVFDVLDQVPQAVLISQGSEGVVSYANLAAKHLWQWPDGARPRTMRDFPVLDNTGVPFDDDLHPLTTGMRTGRAVLGAPLTIRSFRGDAIEVLGTIAPVEGSAGVVTGAVAILQDRSQLRRLDEAKEAFVAMVAHELRNPLTSVVGNVQLLERRIAREPEVVSPDVQKRVETVGRQVGVLSGLVSRLLDRSRLEFAQLDIRPVPTDVVVLVERACVDTEPLIEGRVLGISAPTRLPVTWDEVRMGQVLSNLLANAARYGEGPIDVRVEEIVSTSSGDATDMVRIVVRDHGSGFPADERAHLFSPHLRIDGAYGAALPAEAKGLGIGLYLSERIVSAHGGTIVASNAEDGGAMVTIEVPVAVSPASVRAEGRAYPLG